MLKLRIQIEFLSVLVLISEWWVRKIQRLGRKWWGEKYVPVVRGIRFHDLEPGVKHPEIYIIRDQVWQMSWLSLGWKFLTNHQTVRLGQYCALVSQKMRNKKWNIYSLNLQAKQFLMGSWTKYSISNLTANTSLLKERTTENPILSSLIQIPLGSVWRIWTNWRF